MSSFMSLSIKYLTCFLVVRRRNPRQATWAFSSTDCSTSFTIKSLIIVYRLNFVRPKIYIQNT